MPLEFEPVSFDTYGAADPGTLGFLDTFAKREVALVLLRSVLLTGASFGRSVTPIGRACPTFLLRTPVKALYIVDMAI